MGKHLSGKGKRVKKVCFSVDPGFSLYGKDTGIKTRSFEKSSCWKTNQCNNNSSEMHISMAKSLGILLLATMFAFTNSYHQSTMFENDRHFSHLSNLEREMTFRTEMGLYYYYFKVIIEAPSIWSGINQLMNDDKVEYPSVINTLERFNLYPEVLIGIAFRTYIQISDYFHMQTKECWKVLRGDGLSPIESCEGLGDPSYFYTMSVFLLNGLVSATVFLYGTVLSDSPLGGILALLSFFFNHGECTRVQWTPPLRESFGYPVFLLQMLIVTVMLRNPKQKHGQCLIAVLTTLFILFWQFAQFALYTQVVCVFCIYIFRLTHAATVRKFLKSQMIGLFVALILLFWNKMLLASFYSSTLVVFYTITMMDELLKQIETNHLAMFIQGLLFFGGSLFVKSVSSFFLLTVDDAHVVNILRSKLSSYKDFHTMLYTCASEFDFLEFKTFVRLTKTLLLPIGMVVVVFVICTIFVKMRKMQGITYDVPSKNYAHVIYSLLQLFVFFILAVFIMRLKLFFTPHLCIIASLAMSKQIFNLTPKYRYAFFCLLISLMAVQGIKNIQYQRNIIGEYSNPDMEELIMWINKTTDSNAVFGGPMPTMANILLSTRRPVVNHPHYENAALRNRTYHVYQVFSRKPANEVYENLLSMEINYLVIEKQWCYRGSRKGCALSDLWDVEDKKNLGKEPLCQKLIRTPTLFQKVFENAAYAVLKL